MIRILSIVLFLAASPLAAACPTSQDLETGVVLQRSTPLFSSVFRKTSGGLSEQRVSVLNGTQKNVSMTYPHPLLPGRRKDSNGVISLSYSQDIADLDRLDRVEVWRSDVVLRVGGRNPLPGRAVERFIKHSSIRIGGCRYKVWVVSSTLEISGESRAFFRSDYAPELGLVLRARKLDKTGKVVSEVRFDRIAVVE